MIAIFEGQPPQNKAELPIKTRVWSFGFQVYSIYIYIYTRGRMVKSSPCTPRLDNFITWLVQTKGPDLYRSKGVWRPVFLGGIFFAVFGIFEKNHLVGFISYNDMCIYIYIT